MRHTQKKALQSLFFCFILLAGTLFMSCKSTQTVAQKQKQALLVKQMVESSNFTFDAKIAYPMGHGAIHLSYMSYLKVSKDTVESYLPYFGRVYTAPIDLTENGIKFKSTDFKYSVENGKEPGHWIVTIKTADLNRNIHLFLDVWENGTAQLSVNDPYKQTISFNGDIVESEK